MPHVLSLSYCLVPLCFGYLGVEKLVKLDFLEFESAPSPILVVSAFVGLWLKKKMCGIFLSAFQCWVKPQSKLHFRL